MDDLGSMAIFYASNNLTPNKPQGNARQKRLRKLLDETAGTFRLPTGAAADGRICKAHRHQQTPSQAKLLSVCPKPEDGQCETDEQPGRPNLVELDDVGMLQSGEDESFTVHTFNVIDIRHRGLVNDFNCNLHSDPHQCNAATGDPTDLLLVQHMTGELYFAKRSNTKGRTEDVVSDLLG